MPRNDEPTPFQSMLQHLADDGFDSLASVLEFLLNEP